MDLFAAIVLLAGAIYTLAGLSPSSYGVVLDRLGAGGSGLVAGTPRDIRGDEWSIWTPLMQACVNNDFRRWNATSYYEEDLRNFSGLPLADWGLAFKPYYWPFFLVSPARAFSFYHAFFMAACLIGYHRLFRRLGFRASVSAPLAVAIFFTAYVQTWGTTHLQIVAGYPFVLLLVMARIRPWVKTAALAYVIPAWLLAHLYPPLHLPLAVVGLATVIAWDHEALTFGNVAGWAAGPALGIAITVAYLWDVIPVMAGTHYPGGRVSSGGGGSTLQWLSQFLPYVATSGYRELTNSNICEASTVGTHLPALTLFFLDWKSATSTFRADRAFRRGTLVLLAVVVLTSAWILLPVPSALGRPLLWHHVPSKRMWLACGLALLMLTLWLLRAAPLRIGPVRLAGFAGCVVAAWLAWEPTALQGPAAGSLDELAILAPVLLVFLLRDRIGQQALAGLAIAIALTNGIGFGLFNPVQRTGPIFEKPRTPLVERFDGYARSNPDGLLVLDSHHDMGAVLNGLGYRAPMHTLLAPRLDVFRRLYPGVESAELDWIFNRFQHIHVSAALWPELVAEDIVAIPADVFHPPEIAVRLIEVPPGERFQAGGRIESRSLVTGPGGSYVLVQGFALVDLAEPGAGLQLIAEFPIDLAVTYPVLRHEVAATLDDPSLMLSGFAMRLEVSPTVHEAEALCLLAVGPRGRPLLLLEQPMNDRCKDLLRL